MQWMKTDYKYVLILNSLHDLFNINIYRKILELKKTLILVETYLKTKNFESRITFTYRTPTCAVLNCTPLVHSEKYTENEPPQIEQSSWNMTTFSLRDHTLTEKQDALLQIIISNSLYKLPDITFSTQRVLFFRTAKML